MSQRRVSPQTVGAVCRRLEKEYGLSRLGNPSDPIDDLVYITLSNRTAPAIAEKTYRELKRQFACWEDVLDGGERKLAQVLAPAGLSQIRCQYIVAGLRQVREDFGRIDIGSLAKVPTEDALAYLTKLPGVSGKLARCVMMYTLGHQVLPVDVHVHRITTRLGWTERKRADQCHEELEALVAPDSRYAFHVGCIQHGRTICRPRSPECTRCCIRRFCRYYVRTRGTKACDR